MKVNTSINERIIRVILGIIFLAVGFIFLGHNIIISIILFIAGIAALYVGISGFCPVYAGLGISRAKKGLDLFKKDNERNN